MRTRRRRSASIEIFEELYHYVSGPQEFVSQVLAGHLAIEFLLRRLICQYDPKLEALADEISHARLIALNREIGTLSAGSADVLMQINGLRNRFAHEMLYQPQLDELSRLFSSAANAFTDYADEIQDGVRSLAAASTSFELDHLLMPGLFLAIVYDLHHEFVARGGDEEVPWSLAVAQG